MRNIKTEETSKYTTSCTRINAVSIWSGIECGIAYPYQTHSINRRSDIFFFISLDLPWNTWNSMHRVFKNALRQISIFAYNSENMEQVIRNTIWVLFNVSSELQFQLGPMHMYLGVRWNFPNSKSLRHESELFSY